MRGVWVPGRGKGHVPQGRSERWCGGPVFRFGRGVVRGARGSRGERPAGDGRRGTEVEEPQGRPGAGGEAPGGPAAWQSLRGVEKRLGRRREGGGGRTT